MINSIYLFDTEKTHLNLLPLSYIRPLAAIRVGINTILEKWEKIFDKKCHYYPVEYLRNKFGDIDMEEEDALFIAGNLLPDEDIINQLLKIKPEESFFFENDDDLIAYRGKAVDFIEKNCKIKTNIAKARKIEYVYDIFLNNAREIEYDFYRLTNGKESLSLPPSINIIGGKENPEKKIFIEEGADICAASINVSRGPVYIGRNAVVMEGSLLRGPLAVCEGAKIRMGSKIYSGCTFGPYCKVGGEIDNTVMFGYSNKAHDGYLGNAVIGEWCNIGAGTNASNLKNDYSKIRIWNFATQSFMKTDLQFCGLIMGDHSKIGVNCMLNTATVIGVGVNLHGAGFPRVFIPNFCEGSPASGFASMRLEKFHDIAHRAMSRRQMSMDDKDREIISHIYQESIGK